MPDAPHRYVSPQEDSGRWADFPFRDGDIVISTRSKSGTTWLQMICALLIFRTPDLPAPLGELSPWLDHLVTPLDEVIERLVAQKHRRFIKTHTPLDGVPIDPRATYVVAGRHPLDIAVSLYHQGDDTHRPPHDRLVRWIGSHADPRDELDSLPGVMWHLSDAWHRRLQPNVVLVHYADLSADLDGTMHRLAEQFGISIDEDHWPDLVHAATFDAGRSGEGRELLSDDELTAYEARAAELAPADMLAWLHR